MSVHREALLRELQRALGIRARVGFGVSRYPLARSRAASAVSAPPVASSRLPRVVEAVLSPGAERGSVHFSRRVEGPLVVVQVSQRIPWPFVVDGVGFLMSATMDPGRTVRFKVSSDSDGSGGAATSGQDIGELYGPGGVTTYLPSQAWQFHKSGLFYPVAGGFVKCIFGVTQFLGVDFEAVVELRRV